MSYICDEIEFNPSNESFSQHCGVPMVQTAPFYAHGHEQWEFGI